MLASNQAHNWNTLSRQSLHFYNSEKMTLTSEKLNDMKGEGRELQNEDF